MSATPEQPEATIRMIRRAWQEGRRIVPILGAGISVESGIPPLVGVVQYLAQLYAYSGDRGASDRSQFATISGGMIEEYGDKPWKYLDGWGWPDRFQLFQDLATVLKKESISKVVGQTLDTLAGLIRPGARELLQQCLPGKRWHILKWQELIQYVTNYGSEYADALFARLTAGRRPGMSHHFTAFLVKLLGLPLILTFNFDDLIEQALDAEGIGYRMFAMEGGARLPHRVLLGNSLAVVKMHGSTHSLLVDERLDRPLSEEYLTAFDGLVGTAPLLMVMGCSGDDRRLRDLLDHVVQEKKRPQENATVRAVWVHFEEGAPAFLQSESYKTAVSSIRAISPGAFLQHLYVDFTSRFPGSRQSYLSHVHRPIARKLGRTIKKGPKTRLLLIASAPFDELNALANSTHPNPTAALTLSEHVNYEAVPAHHPIYIDLESQHSLAAVVGSLIDQCRKCDTDLAPSVLPLDGVNQSPGTFARAVEHVLTALSRGRYVVALEGLEAFPWPPTAHHGLTASAVEQSGQRIEELFSFLGRLVQEMGTAFAEGDGSYLCASIDANRTRYPASSGSTDTTTFGQILQGIRSLVEGKYTKELVQFESVSAKPWAQPDDCGPNDILVLPRLEGGWEEWFTGKDRADCARVIFHCLATFRRTRTLPALRSILGPFVGYRNTSSDDHPVDDLLTELTTQCESIGLLWAAGGGVWFERGPRDWIYAQNSRATTTKHIEKFAGLQMNELPDEKELVLSAAQCFLLSLAHQWAAKTYFTENYVQSKDSTAFFEYTYHRISSIRYLSKLLGLFGRYSESTEKGIKWAVQVVRNAFVSEPEDLNSFFECDFNKQGPLLRQELCERHANEIGYLHRSWMRSEYHLRSEVPAQQILQWCRWIDTDDLPRFNPVEKYKFLGREPYIDGSAESAIKLFRNYLMDLRARIEFERGNYDECKTIRGELLKPSDTTKPDDSDVLHWQLDVSKCEFELSSSSQEVATSTTKGKSLADIKSVRERADALAKEPGPNRGAAQEAVLRAYQIGSQYKLPVSSVFDLPGGFTGEKQDEQKEPIKLIREGLRFLRRQDPQLGRAPQNPLVNQTTDGSLYLPYRSLFHILLGRATWPSQIAGSVENAFRYFEYARGGIGDENRLLRILADLYAAEAGIALSRMRLYNERAAEADHAFGEAEAKLAGARSALKRAREQLLLFRRNVVWWRLFFSLVTQYHSDRLLLTVARARQRGQYVSPHPARFVSRVRRAYQALKISLDYSLKPESATEWLNRCWWEIALAAIVNGSHCGERPTAPVLDGLRHIITREREPLSNQFNGLSDTFDKWIDGIMSGSDEQKGNGEGKATQAEVTGLTLRIKILNKAATQAKIT